jgi:hypothetical protein
MVGNLLLAEKVECYKRKFNCWWSKIIKLSTKEDTRNYPSSHLKSLIHDHDICR